MQLGVCLCVYVFVWLGVCAYTYGPYSVSGSLVGILGFFC